MEERENEITKENIEKFLYPDLGSEEMNSIEEEMFKDFDPEEIFRAHKDDLSEFKRCMELLEDMKKSYDPGKNGREDIEHVYILIIDILYHMARRFHPLSEHGKEILKRAADYRKEFEKTHGALISSITKDNAGLFSDVLSEDMTDEIKYGKCRGIGALRTDEEGTFAAGALCYYIENDPADNEPVIRIKWLYVGEEWRGTGVAGSLIGEMAYQMTQIKNISAMTIDYPALIPESDILGELLQEWHFAFRTGLNPEFICNAGDIKDKDDLKKYGDKAVSLEGVNLKDLKIKGFRGGNFDKMLSFYTGDIKKPDCILLGNLCPSGNLRVEHLYCKEGSEKDVLYVLSAFLLRAAKGRKDTEITIPVEAIEVGAILDKLVPEQQTDLLIEGILLRPGIGEDLTGAEVKDLISSLDK